MPRERGLVISIARYIRSSVNEKIKQGTVSGELDHVIIKHGTLTGELFLMILIHISSPANVQIQQGTVSREIGLVIFIATHIR